MSASREKKSRQENLAGGYVDPRTKREKDEQAKDRRSNALYIAIAVIFVIVGIVVTVANSKVIERNADAVTIGNETYTAADVSYFYNTIYSSFVSKNSYYLSVYGLDTSKSLKEQDCPINGSTWYDYFRDQALESLKSYALLAQKAEAEGFDGSEAVEQSVQDTFADLDAAAASAGYTRAQHIKAVCGPLVNEKVFERNIRMIALAQAYSDSYSDSLSYTSDEVQAAYDADPKSYQSADIEYILFTSAAGDDATDEEKAELLEQAKQKAETALSRYAQGETFDTIGEDMEGSYAHIGYAENGASDTSEIQLHYGDLLSTTVNGTTIVLKAKITSSLTKKMTIASCFYDVYDAVEKYGLDQYDELQYWAVADMTDGSEQKVISFTVPHDTLEKIANESIVEGQLQSYSTDVWLSPALQ